MPSRNQRKKMSNSKDQQQRQKEVDVKSELVKSTEVERASPSPQSTGSGNVVETNLSSSPTNSVYSSRGSDVEVEVKRVGDGSLVHQEASAEEEPESGGVMGAPRDGYRRLNVVLEEARKVPSSTERTAEDTFDSKQEDVAGNLESREDAAAIKHDSNANKSLSSADISTVGKTEIHQPIVNSRIQLVSDDLNNLEGSNASYYTAQDVTGSQTSVKTALDGSEEASGQVDDNAERESEESSGEGTNGKQLDDSEADELILTQDERVGRKFENSTAYRPFHSQAMREGDADSSEQDGEVQPYPLVFRDRLDKSTDDSADEDEVHGLSLPRATQSGPHIGQKEASIPYHGLSGEASDEDAAVGTASPRSTEEVPAEDPRKIASRSADSDEEEKEERDDDAVSNQVSETAKETSSGGFFGSLMHGLRETGKQVLETVAHSISSVTGSLKQQSKLEEEEEDKEEEEEDAGVFEPDITASTGSEHGSTDHNVDSIPPLIESFEEAAEEVTAQQKIDTHEASATAQESGDESSVGSSLIPERELAQPVHSEEGSIREASIVKGSVADLTGEKVSVGSSTPDIPAARQDDAAPFTTIKTGHERPTSAPSVSQDTKYKYSVVLGIKSNADRDEGARVIASPRVSRVQQPVLPAGEETGTPYQALRAKPTASDDQNDTESISSDEEALTPSPAQQTRNLIQNPYAPLPGVDSVLAFISEFVRLKEASRAQSTEAHGTPIKATPSQQHALNTPPHQPTHAPRAHVSPTQVQAAPRVTPSGAAQGLKRDSHKEDRGIFSGCCGKVPSQSSASSVSLNRYSYDQPRAVEEQRASYRPPLTANPSYF